MRDVDTCISQVSAAIILSNKQTLSHLQEQTSVFCFVFAHGSALAGMEG